MSRVPVCVVLIAAAFAVAGCGSAATESASTRSAAATTRTTLPAGSTANATPAISDLSAAERPRVSQFPPVAGRTLQQMIELEKFGAQLGAATGTFTPGTGRYAFALNAPNGKFIYAPTALYIARSITAPAQGPSRT